MKHLFHQLLKFPRVMKFNLSLWIQCCCEISTEFGYSKLKAVDFLLFPVYSKSSYICTDDLSNICIIWYIYKSAVRRLSVLICFMIVLPSSFWRSILPYLFSHHTEQENIPCFPVPAQIAYRSLLDWIRIKLE